MKMYIDCIIVNTIYLYKIKLRLVWYRSLISLLDSYHKKEEIIDVFKLVSHKKKMMYVFFRWSIFFLRSATTTPLYMTHSCVRIEFYLIRFFFNIIVFFFKYAHNLTTRDRRFKSWWFALLIKEWKHILSDMVLN